MSTQAQKSLDPDLSQAEARLNLCSFMSAPNSISLTTNPAKQVLSLVECPSSGFPNSLSFFIPLSLSALLSLGTIVSKTLLSFALVAA